MFRFKVSLIYLVSFRTARTTKQYKLKQNLLVTLKMIMKILV